ncbi:MAG: DegV family protein [Candidatus Heimdallarchaeota archaeon]
MQKVAILSDDTCDLPKEILEKYNITLVPIRIIFSDKIYNSCGSSGELTLDEYYGKVESEIPTTSTPSPGMLVEAFEKALAFGDSVIGVFISDKMSPIYSNSMKILQEYFPNKNISIFDSKVTSVALGAIILEIAIMAAADHSHDEIVEKTQEFIDQVHFAGIMFTMENLVRTGRVPRTKKFLADTFKIKPIVKFTDGEVAVQGKIRANDKVIVNQMKKYGKQILTHINDETDHIVIGHTRWLSAAKEIADYIEQYNTKKKTIIIQETGAIVANFVGKKTLTIGYIGEYKEKWLSETK